MTILVPNWHCSLSSFCSSSLVYPSESVSSRKRKKDVSLKLTLVVIYRKRSDGHEQKEYSVCGLN